VILLDISLPGLDGFEVARRIRADSSAPHSGRVDRLGHRRRSTQARDAGFDEHLVKPVEHAHLAALIARVGQRE
jgi:CheY-like chemotaxis protein